MSAIGPGDWVEYWRGTSRRFSVGSLYQVVEIEARASVCRCCSGCPGIIVYGVGRPSEYGRRYTPDMWSSCGFRPIYRPKSELLESLLKAIPAEPESVNA